MTNKLFRPLISCLLIIALLVPAVAQAMPAAPAGPPTWPVETLRDYAVPAWPQSTGANGADSDSPVDSIAPNEPVGRLLLSPAIDADGDPLTNPVGSVPVQRVGGSDPSQDVLYAEISLAAEVLPDDPQRNPAGAVVTFRVWHESDPVEIVRAARADAWGAAATQILFDDLHLAGRWFYQAGAPGYGETPVRSFAFDTAAFAEELRLGAARVVAAVEASGRLAIDIASDVAIDEGLSAVELLVFKQVIGEDGAPQRQMLPAMVARRYEIVIESLMDQPVEDKLTVQVHGPGDVVIYEETVPILLDPARPLRHTVSVPADLNEPQVLRIVVHDPLDVTLSSQSSGFVWFAEKIESAIDTSFNFLQSLLPPEVDITGSFKGSLTLLGIEIATWTQMCELKVCPSMSTGGLWFQPGDWVNIVTDGVRNYVRDTFNTSDIDEAVKRLKDGLPLGTGSGTAALGLRYTRSLYRGRCEDPAAWEAAKNLAVALGRKVKGTAGALNHDFADLASRLQRDPWEPIPVPLVPFLSLQFAPILTFQVDGDYQAPASV